MGISSERVVLGIDAAWTRKNPSGVALAMSGPGGWKLIAAEPSYPRFNALADSKIVSEIPPSGSLPAPSELLATCRALCGQDVDLVAVDMPLSRSQITGRRVSDDAVSKAYGGRKCATHTPNVDRPGEISVHLRDGFQQEGYELQTEAISTPGLIEVYPHPALVELAKAKERLPYKAGKTRQYCPNLGKEARLAQLYQQWREIVALLDRKIEGVGAAFKELPTNARMCELKEFEDRLDAVVCAWVAICALSGRARAFGDRDAAIWIPVAG